MKTKTQKLWKRKKKKNEFTFRLDLLNRKEMCAIVIVLYEKCYEMEASDEMKLVMVIRWLESEI